MVLPLIIHCNGQQTCFLFITANPLYQTRIDGRVECTASHRYRETGLPVAILLGHNTCHLVMLDWLFRQ